MQYRMWVGRKVQIWELKSKKFIGIGLYMGSKKIARDGNGAKPEWVKIFDIITGKFQGHSITELECRFNPLKIGINEMTGLS